MINLLFSPTYDPCYPIDKPENDGVFCVVCNPALRTYSAYIKRDTYELMTHLRSDKMLLKDISIYKINEEMISIYSKEHKDDWYPLLIKGRVIKEVKGPCVICGNDFTNLPKEIAVKILLSTRLLTIGNDVNVCVNITE